ncbi:MAG TPA: heme exporter protein CcmD [Chromatiaceae bacterium]|nr:heme exporter protein CcmD [Chromatiaceae bacterium]HIN82343.1 heme exporter protein CcmD [Chromatiales bacterium]HIA08048.1 heme exporter protein CcmD [Chromatiaceae bacterium]HIB85389.1 heme exporter protein CcmD [Chromatiaceae bacterium]HIO14141.1 heme exporter protein CcmD [Chromatiales bacterium]
MSEFMQMGGYALYVWPAYGLAVAVLLLNMLEARRHERELIDAIYDAGINDEN